MFLSLMLWFILDSEKSLTVLVDGDRVYAVTDIINTSLSQANEDCDEEDEHEN